MLSKKLTLKILVTVVLCSILLNFVDWRLAGSLLLNLKVWPVIGAFILLYLGIALSSFKWHLLMNAVDVRVPIKDLMRLYLAASFFQNFLPSSVGGDIVRLTVMRKTQRLALVAASIFVERLTGLITLLMLAFAAFLLRPQYFNLVDKSAIIWFCLTGLIVSIIVFLKFGRAIASYFSERLQGEKNFLQNILAKFEKLMLSIGIYREKKSALVVTFIISLLFYSSLISFQYLTFVSLGIDIPFKEVILIAPIIPLISLLPISFNGIGVAEGAFVILYTQLGISPEAALAVAVLRRILILLISLIGGIYILQGRVTPRS